jgi:hypothetical protein
MMSEFVIMAVLVFAVGLAETQTAKLEEKTLNFVKMTAIFPAHRAATSQRRESC